MAESPMIIDELKNLKFFYGLKKHKIKTWTIGSIKIDY